MSIKLAYIAVARNNLGIFGIRKVKNLSDFVTTERDVQKGNNRLPLNLARVYEEDLMSDDEVEAAMTDQMSTMKIDNPGNTADNGVFMQDDIMENIEHKQNAMKRHSQKKNVPNSMPSPKERSVSLY